MNYETLRLIRNILLRSFVVGIVITLILGFVTVTYWGWGTGMASQWFHLDAASFAPLVIKFFLNVRFLLLYLVLVPALAIHWTLKKEKPGKK